MAIWRGEGGTGESSSNTAINLITQIKQETLTAKEQAEVAALTATTQATAASASAASAAANASALDDAVAAAQAAQASAEAAEASAESSEADAEAAQAAAEAAQVAAEAAVSTSVTISTNQTITGIKTFSQTIVGSIDGNAETVTNGVTLAGTQTLTNKTLDGGSF